LRISYAWDVYVAKAPGVQGTVAHIREIKPLTEDAQLLAAGHVVECSRFFASNDGETLYLVRIQPSDGAVRQRVVGGLHCQEGEIVDSWLEVVPSLGAGQGYQFPPLSHFQGQRLFYKDRLPPFERCLDQGKMRACRRCHDDSIQFWISQQYVKVLWCLQAGA
jgi:hypothetical protein